MSAAQKIDRPDANTMLHVRLSDELKSKATETLGAIGLTTSEAVRLFLHRVVAEQRLPLDLRVPNAVSRAAMTDERKSKGRGFETPAAMCDALEKAR